MPQYGHSTRGYNLQNLKDVGGTTAKNVLSGGFRAPLDWQREVDDVIKTYKNENVTSTKLRSAAVDNIRDGKRNLSKHLNATESALANKIRTCQDAKAQLDKAILDVDLELQHLTRTSTKLQKLLARRQAALNLSEKRLKVRSKRPNRELTNDKVQLNLINQGALLHDFVHKLERGLRAVEHNSAKLHNVRAALAADATDKTEAIRINKEALAAAANTVKGADVTAEYGPPAMDPVVYPHNWAHATESGIKSSKALVGDSQGLRQSLHKLVAENNDAATKASQNLEQTMQSRIEMTRQNRRALEEQLRNISDESARARSQRAALRDNAKARSGPLLLVRHRAMLRRTVPDREHVADQADHALRKEMRALQLHCNDIDAHEAALDAQIRRLDRAREQVEAHLCDKDEGEQVDVECALLDGRSNLDRPSSCAATDISSLYSFRPNTSDVPPRYGDTNHMATRLPQAERISNRFSEQNRAATTRRHFHASPAETGPGGDLRPISAPSLSGSARAKQRIEMLESELGRARQERLAMEDHVSNLAHELA